MELIVYRQHRDSIKIAQSHKGQALVAYHETRLDRVIYQREIEGDA